MQKLLHCYAEGRDGRWEAFCLDFDLAVQGASFEEVYRSLDHAVQSYLDYVHSLPAAEQQRFLGRRVPLTVRLGFALRILAATLFGRPGDGDSKQLHGYTRLLAA